MKKHLSLILAAVMLLSGAAVTASAEEGPAAAIDLSGDYTIGSAASVQELKDDQTDEQGVYYTLDTEALTAVVGKNTYADSSSAGNISGKISIPAAVSFGGQQYNVTAVGRNAFDGSDITEVIIPETVTTVGEFAFAGCTSLERAYVASSEIKGFAFWQCPNLTDVYVGEAKTIGGGAFWNCTGLKTVTLNKAEVIMEKAFEGCTGITEFVMTPAAAPEVAAGALGSTASIMANSDASGYDALGLSVTAPAAQLYTESMYASKGETAYLSVTAPAGLDLEVGAAVEITVTAEAGASIVGLKSDSTCVLNGANYADGKITGTLANIYPGAPIAILEVSVSDTAAVTASIDGAQSIAGGVTVCTHENSDEIIVKSASCEEAGTANVVCSLCHEVITTKEFPATGHDYKDFVINPTCTESGYTRHICQICGTRYSDSEVDAVGHVWDEGFVTTEPTPTREGIIKFTCENCGITREERLPKVVYGDADNSGSVNSDDVIAILRYIVGWNMTEAGVNFNESFADANVDGIIDSKDAIIVLRHLANWDGVVLGPQQ